MSAMIKKPRKQEMEYHRECSDDLTISKLSAW